MMDLESIGCGRIDCSIVCLFELLNNLPPLPLARSFVVSERMEVFTFCRHRGSFRPSEQVREKFRPGAFYDFNKLRWMLDVGCLPSFS